MPTVYLGRDAPCRFGAGGRAVQLAYGEPGGEMILAKVIISMAAVMVDIALASEIIVLYSSYGERAPHRQRRAVVYSTSCAYGSVARFIILCA